MNIIAKIKQQFTSSDIRMQKAIKVAETERFLSLHRQAYRATQPMGFKSRADSSYYFAMRPHR